MLHLLSKLTICKRGLFTTLAMCFFIPNVYAQQTSANNILGIYQIAKKNSLPIKIGENDLAAQVANTVKTRSNTYPRVIINGGFSRYQYSSKVEDFTKNTDGYGENKISLHFTQPLLKKGLLDTVDAYNKLDKSAEMSLQIIEDAFCIQVVDLILNNLIAEDNLAQIQVAKDSLAELSKVQKRKFELGAASKIEVLQIDAELAKVESSLIQAQNFNKIAQLNFVENTGIEPKPSFMWIVEEIDFAKLPNPPINFNGLNEDDLITQALQNNHEIQKAKVDVDAMQKLFSASNSDKYPSINFSASATKNLSSGHYSNVSVPTQSKKINANVYNMGVFFEFPLYSGGASDANIKIAAANLGKSQSLLDLLQLNTRIAVKSAIANYQFTIAEQRSAIVAMNAAKEARNAVVRGGELGLKNTYEILQAEQNLLATKAQVTTSKTNLIKSYLLLQKLVGKLSENDLQVLDNWIAVR